MNYTNGLYFENEEMLNEAIKILNILNKQGKNIEFQKMGTYEAICNEEADCVIPQDKGYEQFLNDNLKNKENINKINRKDLVESFAESLYHSDCTVIDEVLRDDILKDVIKDIEIDLEEKIASNM